MSEQEMRIINSGSCGSLSGKSTLTYQIGCNNNNEVYIALTGNSGGGFYNGGWVSLEQIYSLLSSQEKISSSSIHSLFQNKSSNTPGFVVAAILKEGLLKVSAGNSHYDLVGQAEFTKIVQAYTKKKTGKKSKGGAK